MKHSLPSALPLKAATRGLITAMTCIAAGTVAALSTATVLAQASDKQVAVPATLMIEKDNKEVDLVGRQGDSLFYRPRGGAEGASMSIKIGAITEGDFSLKYDNEAVYKALFAERWAEAASILLPAVTPILPYLDIPENNGAAIAMDAALAILKAARTMPVPNDEARGKQVALYRRAYSLFKAISKASWTPDAELATLRAVECLTAVGDVRQAEQELESARVPEPGDESYGLYWLVKATLEYARKQTRDAMNSAVRSVAFDNKNVETFPDALFMTARCYEDLLEWYRARDVYYEVARLFPGTGHATVARDKLQTLLDKGLTKDKETSPIESVFFGLDEDINKMVRDLLKTDVKVTEEADREDIAQDAEAEAASAARKTDSKKAEK